MKRLILIITVLIITHVSFMRAQCLQIESILVDACVPGGGCSSSSGACTCEGRNEMVLFKVGASPINTTSLTPTWPNNSFKGWKQNATTAANVATLNSTIVKCGFLKEPVGNILPANSEVLIITSWQMCTGANSFANLQDTLVVLFQDTNNFQGHFVNQNNGGTVSATPSGPVLNRTLTLSYPPLGCSESVTYHPHLLVNNMGTYGGTSAQNDGATVLFDALGNATYVNNGCQAPYIPIQVSATAPSTVCVNSNATIGATVSGPAVTYTWSTSGTGTISVPTGTLSGTGSTTLSPSYTPAPTESGTVTFTLTAQGKCSLDVVTATTSMSVIALPTPTVTTSGSNTICNGSSLVLSVNNQSGSTYSWNPGAGSGTSFTVSPSSQTVYTATATNACASIDATFTVNVNALPVVSASSASVCPGFTATITASGASTYTWNTGTVNGSLSAAPASTTQYTVTGTDVNGCVNTGNATITVYNTPTVTVNSPAICVGATVTLNAGGASTYTWSTTQNGGSISVSPGSSADYTVTGTDANGCINSAVASVTVDPLPLVTVNSVTICPAGTATLTAGGASTFTWSTGSNNTSISVSPASNATYTVSGTDNNGCANSAVASVTISGGLSVSAVPASTVICNGSSTTITASGAASYTWSPAGSLSAATGGTVTASPTAPTTYTVIGSSGACADTNMVTVNVNNLPPVGASASQSVICNGASVTLNASGAQTYTWTGGVSDGVSFTPSSSQSYTVTGIDINGCTNSAVVSVTVNPLPNVTVNSATICPGNTATLTAGGATTFTWSTTSNSASISVSPASNTSYTVTGTDGNGCINSNVASVTIVNSLTVSAVPASIVVCSGTPTTLSGNGAASYTWSPSGSLNSATGATVTATPTVNTTYTVIGSSGSCSDTNVVTINVNNLPNVTVNSATICVGDPAALSSNGANSYSWSPAGGLSSTIGNNVTATPTITASYTVTGTDANNCMNTAVAGVVVNPLPSVTVNSPAICAGSTATLTAGGASTFTWSTSQNGASISISPSGSASYTVSGTDANGCVGSSIASVTVNPLPTILSSNATVCLGSTATLTANGGTTYTWSTSQTGSSISVAPLTNASYTVVGTDNNGCSNFSVSSVTVNPLPVISVNSPSVCAGVTATLTATGAATYTWSNAQTASTITVNPGGTATYSVVGTDLNACAGTSTATVTINQPPVITVTSPTACANSTATLTASGASTYTWSTLQTGASIQVPAGNTSYTVVGQNVLGCLDTAVATVTQINAPMQQAGSNSVICNGQTGVLSVPAGPYTYTWSGPGGNIGNSSTITVSQAGVYTLVTGDACGTVSSLFTVTVSSPQAGFTASTYSGTAPLPVVFSNASTGTIVSNYWNFSNGDTSFLQNPGTTYAMGGVYTVTLTVIDQNGCIDTAMRTITVTDTIIPIAIPNIFSPNGDNINEVFMIRGGNVTDFNCKIYDRWGILLYEFNDIHGSWDGKNVSSGQPASDGTYYYLVSYRTSKGQVEKKPGFLQLVR